MQFRTLGETGLTISTVSFGTSPLGELFGPLDESDAIRLIDEVIDSEINFIDTSPYYGNAEERLGKALTPAKRDGIILGTKAGRYGFDDFDFSPSRIRRSMEESLRTLGTDYVDVFQLHDIDFVDIGPVLTEGFAELQRLKDEGKCRFIGMTGYPINTFRRVIEETDVDVVLTFGKSTLLDSSLDEQLAPVAETHGVGLMNAAAVALGLLTPGGSTVKIEHPAPEAVQRSAQAMKELAVEKGIDIAFLANQFAIQRTRAATTVIGSRKSKHLQSAIRAADEPIDEELLAEFLALRAPADRRQWDLGLPENR
ncbi:aldo/keto reductase [Gulosibacter sp. 10]|uniref:aldo/keto reductase n=1 Tax=Gulosibacter sp. 10 TaxID=1255570 RepID=UPI00097EE2EA|nr:aldo/keto reductase [Gulosibacter sp. 10]SJM67375.1 L-fuco-beta-pyranose dehydrogenase [Gulosibacter sp. 10]